jgi:anti-anti-sigma factor
MRSPVPADGAIHPVLIVRADRQTGRLRVFGELDASSARELLCATAREFPTWMRIGICLESVFSFDASALVAFVKLRELQRSGGGEVTVVNAPDSVARVFVLHGCADMLDAATALALPAAVSRVGLRTSVSQTHRTRLVPVRSAGRAQSA